MHLILQKLCTDSPNNLFLPIFLPFTPNSVLYLVASLDYKYTCSNLVSSKSDEAIRYGTELGEKDSQHMCRQTLVHCFATLFFSEHYLLETKIKKSETVSK